jgi:hypothetical protein
MTYVTVTEELLEKLYEAQKERLIEVLQTNRNGDDGGDYINSAIEAFRVLQDATQDQSDTVTVQRWLNFPHNPNDTWFSPIMRYVALGNLASDGICQAIYDLNPPALEWED